MQELEKILRELEEFTFEAEVYNNDFEGAKIDNLICLGDVIDVLKKHINDDWIPVKERLPEEEYYPALCVTNENYYCVAVYNKTHGFRTGDICAVGEIVAWRPLLKLYKPKRRRDEDEN